MSSNILMVAPNPAVAANNSKIQNVQPPPEAPTSDDLVTRITKTVFYGTSVYMVQEKDEKPSLVPEGKTSSQDDKDGKMSSEKTISVPTLWTEVKFAEIKADGSVIGRGISEYQLKKFDGKTERKSVAYVLDGKIIHKSPNSVVMKLSKHNAEQPGVLTYGMKFSLGINGAITVIGTGTTGTTGDTPALPISLVMTSSPVLGVLPA